MKLIGMLDSPFVRRTAIGLHLLDVSFDHESISVLREFKKFQGRNSHASVLTALAFQFGHAELGPDVDLKNYLKLSTHQKRREELPIFKKFRPFFSET